MSKSAFKEWWDGPNSPARQMPASVADQVEWVAKSAFSAGTVHEHSLWKTEREPKEPAFTFEPQLGGLIETHVFVPVRSDPDTCNQCRNAIGLHKFKRATG